MEFKELLAAIRVEVNRLGMTDIEVNRLVKGRYGKPLFINLTENEQLDFLEHLREESDEF